MLQVNCPAGSSRNKREVGKRHGSELRTGLSAGQELGRWGDAESKLKEMKLGRPGYDLRVRLTSGAFTSVYQSVLNRKIHVRISKNGKMN